MEAFGNSLADSVSFRFPFRSTLVGAPLFQQGRHMVHASPDGWTGEREEKMGLLQRLKHDLKAGLVTLRLGTAQAANRALEETELLRVRLEIRKLDQQLDEHYRDVGERAVSLREAGEPAERILYDTEITRLVKEIQQLKEARENLELDMAEIREHE